MIVLRLLLVVPIFVLAACGAPSAATQPTPAPIIITVVVSPTPEPATPTLVPTETPEPSPTKAVPTPKPTATPVPAIRAKIIKAGTMTSSPAEGYVDVAPVEVGQEVEVRSQANGWFEVVNDAEKAGWVPGDWVDLAPEVAAQVPSYPEALVIFAGNIVQDPIGNIATVFKGKVRNVGSGTAYQVQVEIETFDENGDRADIVNSFVDGIDIPPGEERSFQVMTQIPFDSYVPALNWSVR